MPLPRTTNVGTIMDELNKSGTVRPLAQKRAIALNVARKNGANIPMKPKGISGYLK